MEIDWEGLKTQLIEGASVNGMKVLYALVIFLVGRWVARMLTGSVRRLMEKRNVDPALRGFATSLMYAALLAFVALAAMNQLGIQTTSFIAVLGAAGLAVGLALQGSLSNFAAGVLIIMFRPFRIGDYVEAGGTAGVVKDITILTTVMHTPDNKKIIVPNSGIMGGNITNFSANDTRRLDLVFGVSYGDDLNKVLTVLKDIVSADQRCLTDPAPTIAVLAHADSSVNIAVRPWVKTSEYWAVFFDMQKTVKLRFDAEGISIPFPQRDVHLIGADSATPA